MKPTYIKFCKGMSLEFNRSREQIQVNQRSDYDLTLDIMAATSRIKSSGMKSAVTVSHYHFVCFPWRPHWSTSPCQLASETRSRAGCYSGMLADIFIWLSDMHCSYFNIIYYDTHITQWSDFANNYIILNIADHDKNMKKQIIIYRVGKLIDSVSRDGLGTPIIICSTKQN